MRLGLNQTAITIADAMLAGEPETAGIVARMAATLGEQASWLNDAAQLALEHFGERWEETQADELVPVIAEMPAFVSAWRSEHPPVVTRIVVRAARQEAPPKPLAHVALPHLPTLADLADWLELTPGDLGWMANRWRVEAREASSRVHHYAYRACEKRDGRFRLIERPKPLLRVAQHKILHGLLGHVPPHEAAHGFRKGRNIVSFAAPHAGKPWVIRLDLSDFFVSVTAARVHALFRALGYPLAVTQALCALVTNRVPSAILNSAELKDIFDWLEKQALRTRHLPQGASTSPALANLCAFRLDVRLAALARSMNATYTRYADDLAFSGGDALSGACARLPVRVHAIAIEEGFSVQPRKTRFMPQGVRQRLAGVVVNRHPNFARDEFDTLKAILTNCVRHGPESQNRLGQADFRASLRGRVAHATMLNSARGARLMAIFERIDWNTNDVDL